MAPCVVNGNTDMYGLGIRIGFYLQWFSTNLARFLVPTDYRKENIEHPLKDEIKGLSFSLNIFSAATFLALVILTIHDVSSLQVVEVYIVLLLTFGNSLALVPIYIWQLLTCCNPYLDPTRWPVTRPSGVESLLSFFLYSGVASYQLWFWFVRVPQLSGLSCQEYGFFLTRIRLNLPVMQVLNILLNAAILFSCLVILAVKYLQWLGYQADKLDSAVEIGDGRTVIRRNVRRNVLQNLSITIGFMTTAIVAVAAELTIKWNNIQGVYSLASAGQTIPFVIGLASLIRILYVSLTKPRREPYDSDGSHDGNGRDNPLPYTSTPVRYALPPEGRRGQHLRQPDLPPGLRNFPIRYLAGRPE